MLLVMNITETSKQTKRQKATNEFGFTRDCYAPVILVTACAGKKRNEPRPAMYLYISSRIKYTISVANRYNIPLYILSAKYGLVCGYTIIEPYEQVMTSKRVIELLPETIMKLKYLKQQGLETVVHFKSGARKEYADLLSSACKFANVDYVGIGHGNMGGTKELESVLARLTTQDNADNIIQD